ncbi:MAG: hypothetical protein CFH08_01923, partial [Alphaproteobacteria bacterium MarineAlpha3_Bin7]
MSEGNSKNFVQQAMGYIVVIVGLTMAITGILNSAPTFWIVPRVGPFPEELIRPIILTASIFIVLVRNPISVVVGKRIPGIARFAWIVDIAIMLTSLWVFWHYYDVLMRIEEGLFDLELFHPIVALTACSIFIILCWRVWGAPLGICGIVALFYLYTGEYWPWIFETAPIAFIESSEDLWFNLNDGILGTIMGILIFTVFPFILLGVLLEGTGGGRSLIKVAFHLTRRFRGGPAHAAILASSLFGTMSGGAVTNVVATGVLTIPMIKRRGFQPAFAGGVEATASSAGQIMPPIMGAAALVMADFTGISYLTII